MTEKREIGNCDLIRQIVDYREQFFSKELEDLIRLAYFMGLEEDARQHCEAVDKVLKEQQERARASRYHKLCMYVQGGIDFVYNPNYGCDWSGTFAERIDLEEFAAKTGARLVNDDEDEQEELEAVALLSEIEANPGDIVKMQPEA